ncbi:unnamed protein product [Sphenostylis stenocarpa]|uniref:Uncharacterized protein n=1 Tax=Sphenostylis stenocarpa TaxID=92480 RepID=A0AA86V402_9FABA|nr:unnamed protein product [Sphenostylis stenocarpa]
MGVVGKGVLKKGSGTVGVERNMDLQSGVTWLLPMVTPFHNPFPTHSSASFGVPVGSRA